MSADIHLYSHDVYGLGHLRRTLALAGRLAALRPDATVLGITGSSQVHAFPAPDRVGWMKLPSISRDAAGALGARHLSMPLDEVLAVRARALEDRISAARPRVLVVDQAPVGAGGELLPVLRRIRGEGVPVRILLALPDIVDTPEAVRERWRRDRIPEHLETFYDGVLVFGSREVFDPIEAYGIPRSLASRATFTGYLQCGDAGVSPEDVRARLDVGDRPLVLVTPGGGGDGQRILRTFLDGIERLHAGRAPFVSVIVTGPFLSRRRREALRARAASFRDVRVLAFTPELPSYLSAADAIVSMGGYNTLADILAYRRPALVIPRVTPGRAQRMRAERLAGRGRLDILLPADLRPRRMLRRLDHLLRRGGPAREPRLDLGGLRRAAECILREAEAVAPIGRPAREWPRAASPVPHPRSVLETTP